MKVTRRSALIGAGAIGAGSLASAIGWRGAWLDADPQPLRIPELLDARQVGHNISLTVQDGVTEFFPGRRSATLGYNGSYLGPTLRVHRGDDVEVTVKNQLRADTTVHWHGLLVPGELDGGPHQVISPGTVWSPVLPIRQQAATLFYHSHVHRATAEQVYAGLAGVLIVADESEKRLDLPSDYGVDDLPLVLQDREFRQGELVLPSGMMALMRGRRGDTILVNGTPNAVARVPRGLIRLRLVNGSNARVYGLSFDDDRTFHWIASEAGLLSQPVQLKRLTLAPGERAEILVDFADGRAATLETEPDLNSPMMTDGLGPAGNWLSRSAPRSTVLALHPQGEPQRQRTVPSQLAAWSSADSSSVSRRRAFRLEMGMGMMGGRMGPSAGRGGMSVMSINGSPFDMRRIDEEIRLGDIEIWEVSGQMMNHPFHVHGVQFEVMSRDGRRPDARDVGLRDTVLVNESVELLIRFEQPAKQAPFMYHCHILEHEDNGMMGQFTVT